MNKAKGQIARGALILGAVLLTAPAAFAQVGGRVRATGGAAISGAKVEVWDSYPGGSIIDSSTTGAPGTFAFGAVAGDHFDLRVSKKGYYPTIVRNLPDPTTNALVELENAPAILTSPQTADLWDDTTTFLGKPILQGDAVSGIDPQGVICGLTQTYFANGAYLLHVFGDDALTTEDEGLQLNNPEAFDINGLPAAIVGATPLFDGIVSKKVRLIGATSVPGATVIGDLNAAGEPGKTASVLFRVFNSGNVSGNFTVSAELDQPWTVTVQQPAGLVLTIDAGKEADVVAGVHVPGGTPDMDVELRVIVHSDTYSSANSGAWTILSVTGHSGVGDGGTGGLIPDQFSLAQNYPNPFNPSTQISYSLKADGRVRLEIVNILGQNIRTLVEGFRSRGAYSEIWDGRDDQGSGVPSGIYFYRLVQDDHSLVRKMVLLK
ncbi:MAG: carboxypeptidase regulatory-like domain-containing protein [candidate division Zixibacteria bacterium]|nr:carboxypeptidase regulatory-like domain-containing protein [candidate division Zixibacteria bacterium]